ncbi:putative transcriptional regulator [Herbihabitans rhizosphaerae]|uniref:Putative transcriptional regulator n=1 Tax=Herbihabitans rhizosphaerae TaxID=1872711 RepID=A0A4Q7L3P3_9PSEU|nr:BlaI/MecI/CopY family transcriptional regulator [Herbihabitans rhizosphaerae]RZS44219.1 putative transcriptional regulator [Herbihabitans rhizosphaerae]
MSGFGDLERAVMEVLWSRPHPSTVRDVADRLADRNLAYTTVMTVLDRLQKKGVVRRQRVGRAWQYLPADSKDAYVTQLIFDALDFTGDRDAVLARFARSVSPAEAEVLRAALDQAAERNEKRR